MIAICKNLVKISAMCLGAILMTGCMDITGRGPAPLAKTIATADEHPRAGHVYCMRGWLGIFSTGMDELAHKVDKEVAAVSVADEEWRRLKGFLIKEREAGNLKEPLVLVGHSWGADDQIRVAKELGDAGITVDLLLVVDPVTPPAVSSNVKKVVCIYKSHPMTDSVPFWRGVPVDATTSKAPVTNINLREAPVGFDTQAIGHVNIEKNENVHEMVLAEIRKVCPERRPGIAHDHATPEVHALSAAPAVATPARVTHLSVVPSDKTPGTAVVPAGSDPAALGNN
jgi:hypothetical protein